MVHATSNAEAGNYVIILTGTNAFGGEEQTSFSIQINIDCNIIDIYTPFSKTFYYQIGQGSINETFDLFQTDYPTCGDFDYEANLVISGVHYSIPDEIQFAAGIDQLKFGYSCNNQ